MGSPAKVVTHLFWKHSPRPQVISVQQRPSHTSGSVSFVSGVCFGASAR